MPKLISPELSEKRRRAGRIGGIQTFLRHGREHYVKAGRRGGRPRLPTLAELEAQQNERGEKELTERGNRLPGGNSLNASLAQLKYKEEADLLAAGQPPEGSGVEVKVSKSDYTPEF